MAFATKWRKEAHPQDPTMRNKRAIPADDIAPSDDIASGNGDELRVALRYIVHHKFTGPCQRRSFEERKVLSVTRHVVKSAVEPLTVLDEAER